MRVGKVTFDCSPADRLRILKIARRATKYAKEAGAPRNLLDIRMDITAAHLNGCPLDLCRLLDADDFTLCHDVFGIERHIDRKTGRLRNYFRPRCTLKVGHVDQARAQRRVSA